MNENFEQTTIGSESDPVLDREKETEIRVHDMRQEFTEEHHRITKAIEQNTLTPPYDLHYANLKQPVIEKIDATDLAIRDEIRGIYIEDDIPEVRKKFDEYFLTLDPDKKIIAVILYHEFARQQERAMKRRK